MIDTYYGMLVRDPFSEIPKTPNRSLYFKDEAWMKYHKYGPARKNFGEGQVDAIGSLELCLEK